MKSFLLAMSLFMLCIYISCVALPNEKQRFLKKSEKKRGWESLASSSTDFSSTEQSRKKGRPDGQEHYPKISIWDSRRCVEDHAANIVQDTYKDEMHLGVEVALDDQVKEYDPAKFSLKQMRGEMNKLSGGVRGKDYIKLPGGDLIIKYIKETNYRLCLLIYHEILDICTQQKGCSDAANCPSYYWNIDRVGASHKDTEVRVTYLGKDTNCRKTNKHFPDQRKLRTVRYETGSILRPSFSDFIKYTVKYCEKYPDYSGTGNNCQHYASGMYKIVTGKYIGYTNMNTEYWRESSRDLDIMDI